MAEEDFDQALTELQQEPSEDAEPESTEVETEESQPEETLPAEEDRQETEEADEIDVDQYYDSIEKQKDEAVKEMNVKQREAAELRKHNEALQEKLSSLTERLDSISQPQLTEEEQLLTSFQDGVANRVEKKFDPILKRLEEADQKRELDMEFDVLEQKYKDFHVPFDRFRVAEYALEKEINPSMEDWYFLQNKENIIKGYVRKGIQKYISDQARKDNTKGTQVGGETAGKPVKGYDPKRDRDKSVEQFMDEVLP